MIESLSARELDVLRLLGTDLDGPDIARSLCVSLNTVRTHTRNVYAKLGVTSRRAAVLGINALLLGSLMYPSRLVPRIIPVLGLIGAPLLIAAAMAALLGGSVPTPSWAVLAALSVAAWELSLGVWLVVKGFKPSPLTAGTTTAGTAPTCHDVTA